MSGDSKSEGTLIESMYATESVRYEKHGQSHVLEHFTTFAEPEEKLAFLNHLKSIEVEKLSSFLSCAQKSQEETSNCNNGSGGGIRPFSGKIGSVKDEGLRSTCYKIGMEAIQKSSVAVLLLAGGQGTRLGFDGPKGIYNFGLASGKTLFCLIAERIRKLVQLASETEGAKVRVPLYIMTSPMNDKVTRDYFESNEYFGLPSTDVIFFSQGVLPCLSPDGQILMESPSKCAMAPDGNGGIYPAMEKCGVLKDMTSSGIEHIHAFAIDNALTKPADPAFIGYCIREKADCGNKIISKAGPHEKIGVIAEKNGKPSVVEYSELSKEMAEMVNDDDPTRLAFVAGNICNHYYTLSFLTDQVLPNIGVMYHIAKKKIPVWDNKEQKIVTPSTINGLKLESFIFDVFPLSSSMAILEAERQSEFAPIKNAPGSNSDSPDTARKMISDQAKKWLSEAGANLVVDQENSSTCDTCEVLPMTSYGGEGLEKFQGKDISCPFNI